MGSNAFDKHSPVHISEVSVGQCLDAVLAWISSTWKLGHLRLRLLNKLELILLHFNVFVRFLKNQRSDQLASRRLFGLYFMLESSIHDVDSG